MPKCDLNTSAWVVSCKFTAYFQENLFKKHLWTASSVFLSFHETFQWKEFLAFKS